MTAASQPTAEVMPALGLLAHSVRVVSPDVGVLIDTPPGDVVLVDKGLPGSGVTADSFAWIGEPRDGDVAGVVAGPAVLRGRPGDVLVRRLQVGEGAGGEGEDGAFHLVSVIG